MSSFPIIRCLFATRAEHEYKYRIKTSKNNKKKPTAPDIRTDKESTNTSKQKVENYTLGLFEQTTKVNVNKLLHSTY